MEQSRLGGGALCTSSIGLKLLVRAAAKRELDRVAEECRSATTSSHRFDIARAEWVQRVALVDRMVESRVWSHEEIVSRLSSIGLWSAPGYVSKDIVNGTDELNDKIKRCNAARLSQLPAGKLFIPAETAARATPLKRRMDLRAPCSAPVPREAHSKPATASVWDCAQLEASLLSNAKGTSSGPRHPCNLDTVANDQNPHQTACNVQ